WPRDWSSDVCSSDLQTADYPAVRASSRESRDPSMEIDMCDYSLEAYQSRPAAVGEKLTLGRFASGSMGFASGTVCDTAVCIPARSEERRVGKARILR